MVDSKEDGIDEYGNAGSSARVAEMLPRRFPLFVIVFMRNGFKLDIWFIASGVIIADLIRIGERSIVGRVDEALIFTCRFFIVLLP